MSNDEIKKCKKVENNMKSVLENEKKQAVKEFAEKVKEKALSHCRTINCYECKFIETTIDDILEEYENEFRSIDGSRFNNCDDYNI